MVKSSFESTKEGGQLGLVTARRRAASGSNVMLCKNQEEFVSFRSFQMHIWTKSDQLNLQ